MNTTEVTKNRFNRTPSREIWDWLHTLVLNFEEADILECGTERGGTFSAMATAGPNYLHAVDAWGPVDGYGNSEREFKHFLGIYKDLVRKFNIEYTRGYFCDVLPKMKKTYDIILYDGAHTEKHLKSDIPLIKDRLKDGGMVMVHDVNSPKCYESSWFWDIQKEYPSYRLGGRFGLGLVSFKGSGILDEVLDKGLIPHIRLNRDLRWR